MVNVILIDDDDGGYGGDGGDDDDDDDDDDGDLYLLEKQGCQSVTLVQIIDKQNVIEFGFKAWVHLSQLLSLK